MERFTFNIATGEMRGLETATLPMDDFDIAFMIDGSVTQTSIPGTGPDGYLDWTLRRPDAYLKQRSVYSGYKKQHGLAVMDIMCPNGINFIYGPCAMRNNDRGIVRMADLDNFLHDVQLAHDPNARIYRAYGDRLFTLGRCICRAHKRAPNGPPLTDRQLLENRTMNSVREEIEHGFADVQNQFRVCRGDEEFKLDQKRPHASSQLKACYLLSNIRTCLYGNIVSGITGFNCAPPLLEEYLY